VRFLRTVKHTAVLPYVSCFVPSLAFAVPYKEDIAVESTSRQEKLRSGIGGGEGNPRKAWSVGETASRNHVSHLMAVRGTLTWAFSRIRLNGINRG